MKYKVNDVVRIVDYPKDHCEADRLHAWEMRIHYGKEVEITQIDHRENMFRASGWYWNWHDIYEPIECLSPLPEELFEIDW